jgi:hypothetical protein
MKALPWVVLAAAVLPGCNRGGDPDAGAWEFKVDTTRSADGGTRQTAWLRVVGREGPEGEAPSRAVILSLDCLPDGAPSTIMTEQALRQGSVEARLALDGDSARTVPGFAGTTASGGQVVLEIGHDTLLGLLSGRRLAVFEYSDGAGSSRTTAEFPLDGLETYRERFLRACASRGRAGGAARMPVRGRSRA